MVNTMRNRKLLLILALTIILTAGCSKKSDSKANDLKKQNTTESGKVTGTSEKEYLKSINYSNLADKTVKEEVQKNLENAGVNSSNINLFFKLL